jgi:tetratricopeptide (TPR) repeat protein
MKQLFFKIICLATIILFADISVVYAQQENNEDVRRHVRYAETALKKGDFNDALENYKEALKLAPQWAPLYKSIAFVYENLETTDNLNSAISSYKRYLELTPNANDARSVQDKIYDLEYLLKKQIKQEAILDDLSGQWVAIDNIEIFDGEDFPNSYKFMSDFIFDIKEVQKTGKYRVTIQKAGSRYYSDGIIEKTINITPAKDNSFTFTFADATVHTPKSGGYDLVRFIGGVAGSALGADWVGDLTNIAVGAVQEADLPSNTQTAYTFALKYEDGKLVGLLNIRGKFSNPEKQLTTQDRLVEITFMKNDQKLDDTLKNIFDSKPDIIKNGKDKYGKKLSDKEIANKLYALDADLGKRIIVQIIGKQQVGYYLV